MTAVGDGIRNREFEGRTEDTEREGGDAMGGMRGEGGRREEERGEGRRGGREGKGKGRGMASARLESGRG